MVITVSVVAVDGVVQPRGRLETGPRSARAVRPPRFRRRLNRPG